MVEQILQIFEKAKLNMAWYNRLQENREVIAQQLNAMAYIMEDCARENKDISRQEGKMLATVKYSLKEAGVLIENLKILEKSSGKKEILLQGSSRSSRCLSVRELAKLISHTARDPVCIGPGKPGSGGTGVCPLQVFGRQQIFDLLWDCPYDERRGTAVRGQFFIPSAGQREICHEPV